jgi:hypothetical protein
MTSVKTNEKKLGVCLSQLMAMSGDASTVMKAFQRFAKQSSQTLNRGQAHQMTPLHIRIASSRHQVIQLMLFVSGLSFWSQLLLSLSSP